MEDRSLYNTALEAQINRMMFSVTKYDETARRIFEVSVKALQNNTVPVVCKGLAVEVVHYPEALLFQGSTLTYQSKTLNDLVAELDQVPNDPMPFIAWWKENIDKTDTKSRIWEKAVRRYINHNQQGPLELATIENSNNLSNPESPYPLLIESLQMGIILEYCETRIRPN